MGAGRGPGGDIVASAIGARTVRIATSTRRVETGVSALPPLLLPLIIRNAQLDGPLGLKRRLLWGLEILRSHLVSRLIPKTGPRRGAARSGRRSDYQESRSGNPYRSFLVPFLHGRHRGLGIPLDEARPLDRTDVRGGPRPGAGGLGPRREHRERRPRLRLLGPRGAAVQRERGRDRRVDRRGAEERVPRLSGRVVWHCEDRPPLRPLARGRRRAVRGLHPPAPRRDAREPLPRPAGLAAPERTWGPRPPPRARLALRGQLALRPRLFPAEPRRPGPPADLHRVRAD